MSRLPTPGGDDGQWGDILNDFLAQGHNSDGTLKNVVHATGDEAVDGIKTFNSSPVVPTPTNSTDAATKAYVDGVASSGAPDADATTKGLVQLAGDLGGTAASPQIAAGVIVDADVNATAAIAQSKIANLTADLAGKVSATRTVNGHALSADVTVTKSDVGLSSVDNTSDINKPISTATQTALDLKAPLASPTFTGTVTVPTPTNATDAATKGYVDSTGSGDASTNTATSVDGEIALFSGTGGKTLKRGTGSGLVKSSSGVMSTVTAPSGTVVGDTDTQTLSNKRITRRTGTVASSATPSINSDNVDFFSITALATNITSMTSSLSGTPTEDQVLVVAIKDDGTARSITWGTSFENGTAQLPTTTVASTRLDIVLIWNTATSKWRCLSAAPNYQLVAGAGTSLTNDDVAQTTTVKALTLNIVEVTSAGTSTWNKPSNALYVDILLVGGGGGGGSGRRGASSSDRSGGGAGSGGAVTSMRFPASMFNSSETLVVGAGGTGGAAKTTNDSNGANGTSGGSSTFAGKIAASGGSNGSGGQTTSGTAGTNAQNGSYAGFNGGAGSNGTGVTAGVAFGIDFVTAGQAGNGSGGGGGGGGITAANAASNGGAGGTGASWNPNNSFGAGGNTGGTRNGSDGSVNLHTAGGGGGGAAGDTAGTVAGGNGGNGIRGSGGGGGGASTNGANSGAGGTGGDGYALITTYVGAGV